MAKKKKKEPKQTPITLTTTPHAPVSNVPQQQSTQTPITLHAGLWAGTNPDGSVRYSKEPFGEEVQPPQPKQQQKPNLIQNIIDPFHDVKGQIREKSSQELTQLKTPGDYLTLLGKAGKFTAPFANSSAGLVTPFNIMHLLPDKVVGLVAAGVISAGIAALIAEGAGAFAASKVVKTSQIGKTISSIIETTTTYASGKAVTSTTTRFIANEASKKLTTGLLGKIFGITMKSAGHIVAAIGTYPFANFLKEEALQALSISTWQAIQAGDIEGAKMLTRDIDKVLANKNTLPQLIPYINVMHEVLGFFKAAGKNNNQWKRIIEIYETEGTTREQNEQKALEDMMWKSDYYDLIREGRHEEARILLESKYAEMNKNETDE